MNVLCLCSNNTFLEQHRMFFPFFLKSSFVNSPSASFLYIFSHSLHPILGPVYWLQQHCTCLFMHWCSPALPCGLCLDPVTLTHSAPRGHLSCQRDLLTWQHRCEQNDSHRSARMRWSYLNSKDWNIDIFFGAFNIMIEWLKTVWIIIKLLI